MPVLRQIAQLGHPVLRTLATPVELPASTALRSLIDDMLATLREADGVGIARTQVYEARVALHRCLAAQYPEPDAMPEVVINPEIVDRSAEMVKGWEGCLSIPGIRGEVPRHRRIRARYQTVGTADRTRVQRLRRPDLPARGRPSAAGSSSSTGSRART